MANKYDLKTFLVGGTDGTAACWVTNIDSAGADTPVPTDKTRFLTYIRVERISDVGVGAAVTTGFEIAIACYSTKASTVTSYTTMLADAKIKLRVATLLTGTTIPLVFEEHMKREIVGSIENPIISVAGGNCMLLGAASGTSATVFAQYYDE